MIFSYIRQVTEGPFGTVIGFDFNPEVPEGEERPENPCTELGTYDGRVYVHVPDGTDVGPQDENIDWKEDTLSDEAKAALRRQSYARMIKEDARAKIEVEIGDLKDLLSDTSKLVEFCTVAVCALLADKSGIVPLTEEKAQTYGLRAAEVLQGIASGSITIRGDFENPDAMIKQIMPRYSKLQKIVKESYVEKLEALGL